MAGGFDAGANGLFGRGGASRVFLFPVWGGGGGVGGLVDSMVSGGGLAYVGVVPRNLGYSIYSVGGYVLKISASEILCEYSS